jgi:hypothetical protein
MGFDYSGSVVVEGDSNKVFEFVQKYCTLPYNYEPWDNGGYEAITFFNHKAEFSVDFWKTASKDYPELKLTAKYQEELAAAYICTIQAGKVVKHIRFDWNDGGVISWSD